MMLLGTLSLCAGLFLLGSLHYAVEGTWAERVFHLHQGCLRKFRKRDHYVPQGRRLPEIHTPALSHSVIYPRNTESLRMVVHDPGKKQRLAVFLNRLGCLGSLLLSAAATMIL